MTINLGEWNDYYKAFSKLLDADITEVVEMGAKAAAVKLDSIVRDTLPPAPRKRKQPFKTDKQRRWWWATMRAKALGQSRALPGWVASYRDGKLEISGAYKRTGGLVQSMTYRVSTQGKTTTARYGTNRKYAQWVVDENKQARYHKGNWKTLQVLARNNAPALVNAFNDKVMSEIERRLPND